MDVAIVSGDSSSMVNLEYYALYKDKSMNSLILPAVQEIFRDVFDDASLVITAETNSTNVQDWDSLAHLSLVTAIERHFKVRFALGELQGIKDVGEMLTLIEKKKK